MGPVHKFDPFVGACQVNGMVSDDIAGPDGVHAYLPVWTWADVSLTPVNHGTLLLEAREDPVTQSFGSAARRIFLVAVVYVDNLDIVLRPQGPDGLLDQA